jgi:hypothetical protein
LPYLHDRLVKNAKEKTYDDPSQARAQKNLAANLLASCDMFVFQMETLKMKENLFNVGPAAPLKNRPAPALKVADDAQVS